jgi:glycosyltransferase involved in cell wall biosynthesis
VRAHVSELNRSSRRFRVSYWAGIWEPRREAISKEVAWLRKALAPTGPVVAFTPQRSGLSPSERVIRINFRRWHALRLAAVIVEPACALSHVFGGIGTSDHFLHLLGRRPILFTVVIAGNASPLHMYDHVARFVAESRGLAAALRSAGVDSSRIETIYPGLNINAFTPPGDQPPKPFKVLFASSPADPSEIDSRGIGLLIEVARARPDVEVIVLWRQWGDVQTAMNIIAARNPPANFRVEQRDAADMSRIYREVHATTCLFEASSGKAAPNSVLEGLATGRPALLTDTCGVADLVEDWGAGVVTARSVEAISAGLDELQKRYGPMSVRARQLAETEFDSEKALSRYAQIYERLTSR